MLSSLLKLINNISVGRVVYAARRAPAPCAPPSFAASSFLISFNVIIAGVALNAIFIACTSQQQHPYY
jgi:hypothetical protein